MWKIIFVEYPPVSGQKGDSIGTLTQFPLYQTHPFLKGFFIKLWIKTVKIIF